MPVTKKSLKVSKYIYKKKKRSRKLNKSKKRKLNTRKRKKKKSKKMKGGAGCLGAFCTGKKQCEFDKLFSGCSTESFKWSYAESRNHIKNLKQNINTLIFKIEMLFPEELYYISSGDNGKIFKDTQNNFIYKVPYNDFQDKIEKMGDLKNSFFNSDEITFLQNWSNIITRLSRYEYNKHIKAETIYQKIKFQYNNVTYTIRFPEVKLVKVILKLEKQEIGTYILKKQYIKGKTLTDPGLHKTILSLMGINKQTSIHAPHSYTVVDFDTNNKDNFIITLDNEIFFIDP